MKTIVTAALLAAAVATPTLAQSQLEQSVGVEAGQLTVSQLAQLHLGASDDSASDRAVNFDNRRIQFSASDIHNPTAEDVFKRIGAEERTNGGI
jgi:hypothetical protein